MSRSRKKKPVVCLAGSNSGKSFRRAAHKAMRAKTRAALSHENYDDVPLRLEEVSDIYDYRDWITYVTPGDREWLQDVAKRQMRK